MTLEEGVGSCKSGMGTREKSSNHRLSEVIMMTIRGADKAVFSTWGKLRPLAWLGVTVVYLFGRI